MEGAADDSTMMRARIAAMLDDIKRRHRVRILLAIESGSRAWGFPSSDSDWDVRFIYVRPLQDYLRVQTLPDVIESPLTDELDLSGWDLRKALALLTGSNAVVLDLAGIPDRVSARRRSLRKSFRPRAARRASAGARLPL